MKLTNSGLSIGTGTTPSAATRQIPGTNGLSPTNHSTANEYSNAHWMVQEPKYLEINRGILEKKRRQ